jgi:predicted dienelactone hydrolase
MNGETYEAVAVLMMLSSSVWAASRPVSLDVGGGTVYGTELTPDGVSGKVPVVLLHAGSGPTDRDGNSKLLPGPNDSLKLLAEGLAKQGSRRYATTSALSAPARCRCEGREPAPR